MFNICIKNLVSGQIFKCAKGRGSASQHITSGTYSLSLLRYNHLPLSILFRHMFSIIFHNPRFSDFLKTNTFVFNLCDRNNLKN